MSDRALKRSSDRPPVPAPPAARGEGGSGVKHAYLLVLAGPTFGEVFRLERGHDIEIGRRPESEVIVQDPGVSRRHATIRVDATGATIRDLGSKNGTFVDGYPHAEVRVEDGSRIQIGASTTLRFAMSDATDVEFQHRLADAALRDPLTGLYNRVILDERIASAVTSYEVNETPLAILALDIDHFKRVNDEHGHLAGDQVLKSVTAAVQAVVRGDDVFARWGGEEFVVLARNMGTSGAQALAERIRRAAAGAVTRWKGRDISVTISVGVASLAPPRKLVSEGSGRVLIEAADRALYRAKESGRNRVELEDAGV